MNRNLQEIESSDKQLIERLKIRRYNWYSNKKLEEWQGIILDDDELIVEIDIYNSGIIYLPESIGLYANLKKLIAISNKITHIPDSIYFYTNLTHIDLSYNNLTKISESICHCINLISLDISVNKLTELPIEIGLCKNLKELIVGDNQLT